MEGTGGWGVPRTQVFHAQSLSLSRGEKLAVSLNVDMEGLGMRGLTPSFMNLDFLNLIKFI